VVDTGDYALYHAFIDSMTPVIILSPVTTTPMISNHWQQQQRQKFIAGRKRLINMVTGNKTVTP
jgi:hypothetical protein